MLRSLAWAVLAAALAGAASGEGAGYKVIVHASNPVAEMKREQVALLFLNRNARWAHRAAAPVDQSTRSDVREAFSRISAPGPASALRATFTQLTDEPGVEGAPRLSPDGGSLLYVGEAAGNSDIYVRHGIDRRVAPPPHRLVSGQRALGGEGHQWKQAAPDQGRRDPASWSPHGQRIAFWHARDERASQRDLATVAANGSSGE